VCVAAVAVPGGLCAAFARGRLLPIGRCVRIAGDIKSAIGEAPAAFIVECVSDVPLVMLVDYYIHYLDVGTREECESYLLAGPRRDVSG
jgi:hypothetical protein